MRSNLGLLAVVSALTLASPALADEAAGGDDGIAIKPLLDARLRYEHVDQPVVDADAVTLRVRAGVEAKASGFSFLAEGEGTAALVDDYNDTLPGNGVEPFSVVADPENIELNRLQISYLQDGNGVTLGRQRIILDNARFVGNVGWRDNEQTFDAVRGQAKLGPVSLDATYSISQRTIFGTDSPNEYFDGDIVLLNGGVKAGPVSVKAFAYLVDYDTRLAFSSQTYGVLAKGEIPLGVAKLSATASYARQKDMGANPVGYSADYLNLEGGVALAGVSLKAGYELLGSDNGTASFQTPLATLHAFNGWADMFLTTPAGGLEDLYFGAGYKLGSIPGLPALNLAVTYHDFRSDVGGTRYGSEWDASLGTKIGPVALLAKFASYQADLFAADTKKFWLQAEFSL